ncbi:class 1 fructose-bisphosphatase [Brevundimonas sp. SORGH_AS_0993]|uniref:class 1 fructose-bisphosphatase n=1 Tax=Brevundimonas sp. SORGH_AS_0993 TaxID=3041794 RepID=UPI00278075F6|nr:class 1 fructose-bisphosphatase [Brevundimonas sp. SORGH_AS_0993]MDQ1152871.1 fructose-1,6-bisphosphatase I [Brevundimonas sp. SORGH_AS_0993]
MTLASLDAHIAALDVADGLKSVLTVAARTCAEISDVVAGGALAGALGASGQINVQDEEQKKLDVMTNDRLTQALLACPAVAGVASEEMDEVQPASNTAGDYLVLFDPLDGSSNIDINASVGTIVSVLKSPTPTPTEADFMQAGRNQVAALYALYGPQTMLVLTTGQGVRGFTLSSDGEWILTHDAIAVSKDTKEFAINMSNLRHWSEPVQTYVGDLLKGADGPRGKNFNMRWVAAMVADVHRILMRGGVFFYPWDRREPNKPGKLRLMYEGNPMAFLIEQAGGKATTDGVEAILDIQPEHLHQRIPVALGSANEIDAFASA